MLFTRLYLQSLESRRTPSNNVTADLVGRDLLIQGDDGANGLSIVRSPSGRYQLEGGVNADTQEATTINGLAVYTSKPVRGNVRIELLGGDDFLLLGSPDGLTLRTPADLTIDTGDGRDAVVGASRTGGSLTIDTGPGDDFVQGRLLAGGSLILRAGAGDDRVLWEGGRALSANIAAGDGDQDLLYLGSTARTGDIVVGGNLTVSEAELVSLNNPAIGHVSATRVGGNFSIRADGTVGLIDMTRVRVAGDLALMTGAGNDSVNLSAVRARNLSIETQDGDDFVAFGGAGSFADVIVRSNLTVRTGAGNDFVNFNLFFTAANAQASFARVGGWVNVDTAQGDDIVQAYTIRPVCGLLIETGDGTDDVAIVQTSVPVLVISLGSGDDSLALAWTHARGFTDGGDGTDRIFHRASRNSIAGLTRVDFEEEG